MILLGVDVGQAQDPSALVGVGMRGGRAVILGAEERPLGETYGALVDAVDTRCRAGGPVLPVVDATGVGRPVLEALRARRDTLGITITSGRRHSGSWPNWRVPKRLLLHVASVGVERGAVEPPDPARWPVLAAQLGALRTLPNGGFAAAGSGHDDLALAWLYAVYALRLLAEPGLERRMEVHGGAVRAA